MVEIEDAADLLVYLESLIAQNVPLHKMRVSAVCCDCDRTSIQHYAKVDWEGKTLVLDWQDW